MSDIVERLRSPNALPLVRPTKLEREAADHIERLAHANNVQAEEIQEIRARLAEAEATASTANHGHELCYKALLSAEARLAEAERHLRNMYAMVHGKVPPDHPFTLSNVSDFLRLNPADESTASSASDALP